MFKRLLAILALLLHAGLALAAVDVNRATEAELDSVKGIGPGTTRLILQERKKAPFKDWADFVDRVKGVGTARAQLLSDAGLVVDGKPYQQPAPSAAPATRAAPAASARR